MDSLPQSAQRIARVIGRDAAMKLHQTLGGARLYIPLTGRMPAKIVEVIGTDAAEKVRTALGAGSHEFPVCHATKVAVKHAAIREAFAAGQTMRAIASAHDMTLRRVRTIVGARP